ncbi:uncharacterized protein TNCV_1487661 [Trichonephila clavipes]|nr:uncharacterized protein TNCV_1487661 [Trichonephila clavipes]
MRQANQKFPSKLTKIGNGEQLDEMKIALIESSFYTVDEAEARCPQDWTNAQHYDRRCYCVSLEIPPSPSSRYPERVVLLKRWKPQCPSHPVVNSIFIIVSDYCLAEVSLRVGDILPPTDTFGDRLISPFGPVNGPPRSCDLTPLDYFLWGYVKSLVYADKPQTLDHLEDNIRRVIADIRPQMWEKVIEN